MRIALCSCLLLVGCLPELDTECRSALDCDAGVCIGGVCVDRPGESPDRRPPPEMGRPDRGVRDGAPPDEGPPPDAAIDMSVADDGVDFGCEPREGACDGFDDDCDGLVDDADEARAACPEVEGAAARCTLTPDGRGCAHDCLPGHVAGPDGPGAGCVPAVECRLDGPWTVLDDDISGVAADDIAQLALAVDGETRLVVRYDADAARDTLALAVTRFSGADDIVTTRAGDRSGDFSGGVYRGLDAGATGDGFWVAAWRHYGNDPTDFVATLAVPIEGAPRMHRYNMMWPQPPLVVPVDDGLRVLVETRQRNEANPMGTVIQFTWDGIGEGDTQVPRANGTHRVGAAYDAAVRDADGAITVVSDAFMGAMDSHGLRVARYDAAGEPLGGARFHDVPGPALDRISIGPMPADGRPLVLAAVDAVGPGGPSPRWIWRRLDGAELVEPQSTARVEGDPRAVQVLDLPAGPGVVYRVGDVVEVVIVAPDGRVLTAGPLPDAGGAMPQMAAWPTGDGFEIAALRDADGRLSVVHAAYVCQ